MASFVAGETAGPGAALGCCTAGEMGGGDVLTAAGADVGFLVAVAEGGVLEVVVSSLRTSESVDCHITCMTSA